MTLICPHEKELDTQILRPVGEAFAELPQCSAAHAGAETHKPQVEEAPAAGTDVLQDLAELQALGDARHLSIMNVIIMFSTSTSTSTSNY